MYACRRQHDDGSQMSTTNETTLLERSADVLRSLPLAAGALGVVAVVLNRAINGVRSNGVHDQCTHDDLARRLHRW